MCGYYMQVDIIRKLMKTNSNDIPYNQNYWPALYLAICSKNDIDGF